MRNLDSIMYLRPFAQLQAVNFVGNPFCQESEYRAYVLAHLKHVKYLDYRLVDEATVQNARELFQVRVRVSVSVRVGVRVSVHARIHAEGGQVEVRRAHLLWLGLWLWLGSG